MHSNVLYHPYNPIGSQLTGMVKHPSNVRRAAYKRDRDSATAEPFRASMYKRPRTGPKFALKRRNRRSRRGVVRRRVPRALTTPTKVIRCKAVTYINFTSAGTLGHSYFQLNSVDDPFTANGTGQPLGYDQWKALYKHAYVIGSKIVAKVHNNGTVAVMFGITPMKPAAGATSLAAYDYYMELPHTKSRIISEDTDHIEMYHKVNTKRFLDLKDIKDNDDVKINLPSEVAPTTIAYWHVWSQALDKAGTIDVDAVITLEYILLLTDPIIPSRSVET